MWSVDLRTGSAWGGGWTVPPGTSWKFSTAYLA